MRVSGRSIVITGAGSGIGAALAARFANEGARGVVVSDIDGDAAARVAAQIGGTAVTADVTDPDATAEMMAVARRAHGPIDVFCANAGAAGGNGLEASDDVWDRCFQVNVGAHVTAARLLVPDWVERGEGYWLSTASAAGLLGVVGSPTYPVTKHASVAFAEWLAITYGDRGVTVSCLCPMGVQTPFLMAGFAQPGEAGAGLRVTNSVGALLDPDAVADSVIEGLADERFLILPHPEVAQMLRYKARDRDGWLTVMRGMQAQAAELAAAPSTERG